MSLLRIILLLGLLSALAGLPCPAAEQPRPADLANLLRIRLEGAGVPVRMTLHGETLHARQALPDFYLERLYQPAWLVRAEPSPGAEVFIALLRRVADDALDPRHYHLPTLEELRALIARGGASGELLVDFDLLASDAFLLLASHLRDGRVNPETIDPEWHARRGGFDPVPLLRQALATGEIEATLHALRPAAPEYARLREQLAHYRRIADQGGWSQLESGPKLVPGERSPRVAALRQRLALSGDYQPGAEDADPAIYDDRLAAAVRKLQHRHGLIPDAAVGKGTLAVLNVPVRDRVRQLEINLERWRWLPRDLGDRYILVNIAAYQLYLVDGGTPVLEMKVVVGRPYRRTPVFSGQMTYLVLNPYWNIPRKIAIEDLAVQMRRDPGYLQRLGIRVLQGWGAEAREIDPATIDWAAVTTRNFAYNLRQDPGDLNALGRIKFMFPNPHDVYLHDTPARELFLKESRSFSSGCIRLEQPLELARYLLRGTPLGEPGALEASLQKEKALTVGLPRRFPVHLLYWTAWVDADGELHFRDDIYGRDRTLGEALAAGPPPADLR